MINVLYSFERGSELEYNALNLNQDKSELLVFSSKFLAEPELNCINVVDQRIKLVLSARNLGVVFVSFSFSR